MSQATQSLSHIHTPVSRLSQNGSLQLESENLNRTPTACWALCASTWPEAIHCSCSNTKPSKARTFPKFHAISESDPISVRMIWTWSELLLPPKSLMFTNKLFVECCCCYVGMVTFTVATGSWGKVEMLKLQASPLSTYRVLSSFHAMWGASGGPRPQLSNIPILFFPYSYTWNVANKYNGSSILVICWMPNSLHVLSI